jgi:hypothetical protein
VPKAASGVVLAKPRVIYAIFSLREGEDRAIQIVAFVCGGRRRSEVAGLRVKDLNDGPMIDVQSCPVGLLASELV